jgi:hypothetical protein
MKTIDQSIHPGIKLSKCDPLFTIYKHFVFWIKKGISIDDVCPSAYGIPA